VQKLLLVVMAVGLAVGVISSLFLFFGLPVEREALIGMGVAATASGLELFGQALFPHWKRGWWKPSPGGTATVRFGRLSSLGASIFCTALGVVSLGYDSLPEAAKVVITAVAATGFALLVVGFNLDKRRAEANKQNEESSKKGSGLTTAEGHFSD